MATAWHLRAWIYVFCGMTDFRTPLAHSGAPTVRSLEEARERAIRLLTDGYAYDVISRRTH